MSIFETEIEVDGNAIEVVVEYEYEPPEGDGFHEPRMEEDVTIYSVKDMAGNEVEYTKGQEAYLLDKIFAHIHQEALEYQQDKAEYQYEAWKERQWN